VCSYYGPFVNSKKKQGKKRQYAICPKCGAGERHRLQSLVLDRLVREGIYFDMDVLHFAPELIISPRLRSMARRYVTADLFRADVDINTDICNMNIADDSYDLVYASHVLEHVEDDRAAIKEIYRVLRPGGIAILPVPIYGLGYTVEYDSPRKEEDYHVRAPGLADYFDRYKKEFSSVEVISSNEVELSSESQAYIREMVIIGSVAKLNKIEPEYVPICRKL
jgi:SAM-dependent methyltransferase